MSPHDLTRLPNDCLARLAHPAIASHAPERELLFGRAPVAIVGLSFLIGARLAPGPAPARRPAR